MGRRAAAALPGRVILRLRGAEALGLRFAHPCRFYRRRAAAVDASSFSPWRRPLRATSMVALGSWLSDRSVAAVAEHERGHFRPPPPVSTAANAKGAKLTFS
jgi:hypothetical protein